MNSIPKVANQLHRHYETLITGDIHPADHPVAKGDAREHGWRKLLRRFLPDQYGVKTGFIIDSSGRLSEQVDCVVYRKDVGIEMYAVGQHTVIPAEVVFGAFEIKPAIDQKAIEYAEKKANSIAELCLANSLDEDSVAGNSHSPVPGAGQVIFGLLADRIKAKKKWELQAFRNHLRQPNSRLSVFMTIEDGCVDTLDTAYPTTEYTLHDGKQALFHQLIRLAEGMIVLEQGRDMSRCCLAQYKNQRESRTVSL